ncbi:uncharacterized protein F5891DRAFT_1196806 [Suillus fuscotomentosus]|uniref:Uncharacterized protein n=1 Tax=Suillus fuscotomentosus TaxID=1912939 RepID=A0AAD4HD02_9AGAM|nr:uncharacterized protein F5891DRAFT_1196806 [Suillus fuscotomentosus]KAG1893085.1 hypothetical protein F5891DRAFT_1196806 [Suillus fuscotomentosus]
MEYPDEVDDLVQFRLDQFLGQSQDMFTRVRDDRRSEIDFIRFVLAGRIGPEADEEVDQCRITLNAQQGIPHVPPRPETTITRDIDSVIGVSRSLPYTTALSVWPDITMKLLTTSLPLSTPLLTLTHHAPINTG